MKSSETLKNTLSLIQEAINRHKSSLADYNFTSSNTHKRIRKCLEESNIDAEKLLKEIENLENHLYEAFGDEFDKQMYYLFSLIQIHSSENVNPRACIKVINVENDITTLYRNPEEFDNKWGTIKFNDNTGFITILEGAEYFLCNNIPQDVIEGKYENSRIDPSKVEKYLSNRNNLSPVEVELDKEWINCWNTEDDQSRNITGYKSTLIVPMTIETESISINFINHLGISSESKRAVLGFLCLDHPFVNFFQEEIDVEMCKIFADTLSLFLFQQLNNTILSKKYEEAIRVVNTN
jgi:hypothetical protein